MTEENKDWVEVEVNSPAPESPKADVTPVEKPEDSKPQPSEEEFGNRAQKRIKQLLAKSKEMEERALKAERLAEERARQAEDALSRAKGTETSAHSLYRNSVTERFKVAEKQFQAAYDAADRDGLLEAQKAMMDATVELKALDAWERGNKAPEVAAPPPPPPQTQQAPQLAPATKNWLDANPWFGRGPDSDRAATALAVSISDDLVDEGYDPNSSDFYGEVERRLVAEMPRMASKFREPEPRKPVVAGQSRNPGRRIRLDEGTVKASQRLGASMEDTARYMEKIQDAGEGYVNIDIKRGRK